MVKALRMVEQAFFMLYSMAPLLDDGETPKEEIEQAIKEGARAGVKKARAFAQSTETKVDDEVYRLISVGINEADNEIESPTPDAPAEETAGDTLT